VTENDPSKGNAVGLAVGAGGVLALVAGWRRNSVLLRAFGTTLALAGGGLYAHGKVAERDERIEATQSQIRSELDDLDPLARAQVLEGLARSEP
jgi:hypothetical protein